MTNCLNCVHDSQVVRMLFTRVVINNKTNLVSLVQIESEEK